MILHFRTAPSPLQRSRGRAVFSGEAGRLFERRCPDEILLSDMSAGTRKTALMEISSEFLPAPKKPNARGEPKAKLPGDVSFASFLCAKEKKR